MVQQRAAMAYPYKTMLTCHPETCSASVGEIQARVSWTKDNGLALTYALKGDLTRLRIPQPQPPHRADGLWQHTCFEAFISVKDKPEYYEFNFAPSGQWAAYRFLRYREGTPFENDIAAPKITVHNPTVGLDLHAIVYLDSLPTVTIRRSARFRLALAAVIEEQNGGLSYWALRHPPGKPDFHHRDAFILDFEAYVDDSNDPS